MANNSWDYFTTWDLILRGECDVIASNNKHNIHLTSLEIYGAFLKPLTVHHPAIHGPPRQNSWPAWSLFNLAFAASQPSRLLYRLHNLKLYDFYDVTNIFMGRALRGRASLGGRVAGAHRGWRAGSVKKPGGLDGHRGWGNHRDWTSEISGTQRLMIFFVTWPPLKSSSMENIG